MPITPDTDLRERQWHVEGSSRLMIVHPGVTIPRRVRAWGPLRNVPPAGVDDSDLGEGFQLEVEAVLSPSLGHYVLSSFSVVAPEDGEVTGLLLRTVTPLGVMRWILPRTFKLDASALSVAVVDFVAPELKLHRNGPRHGGSTIIELADVGTVYRLATIVRYPPKKAVAETFGFEARTATNWIARARALGLT